MIILGQRNKRQCWLACCPFLLILLIIFLLAPAASAQEAGGVAVRIKDVARLVEDRPNQLTGFGLVVGLNGTGDSSQGFALEMVLNFLAHHGFTVDRENIRVRNVAAVALSATLPMYKQNGDELEVTVSSIGDAKSLQGGVLLQSPLTGADGRVYAVAQGPVVVGGFTAETRLGSRQTTNQPTVGFVQAIVENTVPVQAGPGDALRWVLTNPDYSTASRMAQAINTYLGAELAVAESKAEVRVAIPEAYRSNPVGFVASIENIQITQEQTARVVVNPRTGTIVFDENVRIAPVAVTRGNITVRISAGQRVSQPSPLSAGQTVVTTNESLEVAAEPGALVALPAGTSLAEIVQALNAVGATPQDIINLIIAIDQAGALYGVLEIR
ncbi:flagellar basal body P-ring protein FlgI [Capillibacterium thermochitinicola]|uniref:Flagellar P-ring protein n=1 Tax=Capillibacterium thermochitinicola TaxID=2699427 RepID=A0A8J6I115_9FIRM|nr:flagellar basal body P-ring protein FlgI [Capillibacterium thermochitinicola]